MEAVVQDAVLPRNRPTQFDAWTQGDGPIIKPMPDGDYLKVQRDGHQFTANEACFDAWNSIQREAQMLSAAGFTMTPMVTEDLVGNTIDAVNRLFTLIVTRVITRSNAIYSSVFGGPVPYELTQIPIRWTGECPEALKYVLKFVEAAYQVPQLRCNTIDNGLPSTHASIILMPLFRLKADIMRLRFRLEVKGDISPQELDAMFRNSNLRPPLRTSFDDTRDDRGDHAAEDAAAMANESADIPTTETLEQAREGVDVWTWVPSGENWATFAEVLRRMEYDGPSQPKFTPYPFSTESVGADGTTATTKLTASAGLTTPQ